MVTLCALVAHTRPRRTVLSHKVNWFNFSAARWARMRATFWAGVSGGGGGGGGGEYADGGGGGLFDEDVPAGDEEDLFAVENIEGAMVLLL